jgi:hypothetical protein
VSCDGVEHFSSKKVNCPCCLSKKHSDGSTTYHHNMLCAALVHPDKREVFLLDAEPILQQDGSEKNDCERNAAKRLQKNLRENYASYQKNYPFLVVEDALYANSPHIEMLENNGFSYILNVKPGSHKALLQTASQHQRTQKHQQQHEGIQYEFEYLNNVALCNNNPNTRVNFLQVLLTDKKGKSTTFTWVTNIKIKEKNLFALMRAARARWKIENETFNTLKNLGYHFEHNYGHGADHLATMFAYLMLLAFYLDQLIQACSHTFQQIEKNILTKVKLWSTLKAIFLTTLADSMEFIYHQIAWHFQIKLE